MSTLAYYHPRQITFDLADMPVELYNEVASWRGHIKRGETSIFTCNQTGDPMYVCRSARGRYFMKHFPGVGHGGHPMSTMSDEHRRQADYTRRAAVDHGLEAALEVSTGNHTRLDVAARGKLNIGFEIQRSGLTRAQAQSRATRSFEAGWPTAWVTDNKVDPAWADHVPTARLTMRGWDDMPPPNTAQVVIGEYVRDRDKTRPTGWWYRREPRAVLLDELAYLMPAGEIMPVAVGTLEKVDLAFHSAAEIIDSCTYPGASDWNPTQDTPERKEAPQRYSVPCQHPAPDDVDQICACGNQLLAPESLARGYCEHCRLACAKRSAS